ncbi:MAG: hypothetical protein IPL61_31090 [Myxococcales bacterium]|nr:hypothetical protein [Myxococcales bacterium]
MRIAVAALLALIVGLTADLATAGPSASGALRHPAGLRARVLVARIGVAGWSRDAMTLDASPDVDAPTAYPLLQETPGAVRILVEEDHARLLVWVARTDLAWTVARSIRILGRGDVGVWLRPGAPLTIAGAGRRVAVHVVDEHVTVDGTVDRAALAHRFVPPPAGRPTAHSTSAPLARAPDGPPLVTPTFAVGVTVIDRGPRDWVLVEHVGAHVRVRGWIRAAELGDGMFASGSGSGSGYGISDTARVQLDAGACMFDERGAVIGVQLDADERYAHDLGDGRWSVYVGTPWGLRTVVVQDRTRGRGPPAWRRCP